MSFTPVSAKNAKVRVNGTTVTANKWTVRPKSDAIDITNFEGNGFADWAGGIIEAEFTVSGHWDSAADPYSNPPNINVGSVLTNVFLYTNGTSSAAWSFPSALVIDTPQDAGVRDLLTFEFTAKAKGAFTSP